jgi:virginiamycin A acetyltransferase
VKKIIDYLIKGLYRFFVFPLKHRDSKIRSHVPMSCKIGREVIIEKDCIIGNGIEIGDFTFIGSGTRIETNTGSIGKYCSIAPDVKIGVGPHPVNFFSTSPVFYSKNRGYVRNELFDEFEHSGYTVIGHDVWIGANAVILAGVKIGTGAVIGSGAVVTKDVPPYAISGGVPAKIIKYRFENEVIGKLLESRWWDKDVSELTSYPELLGDPSEFVKKLEDRNKK